MRRASIRRTGRCSAAAGPTRSTSTTASSVTFTDPDAFTDLFAQMHDPMGNTYHRLSNFVIDVDGDTATARTYVHAVLMVTPDDNAPWVDVIGHYDDELVRGADGWRIRRRVTCTPRMLTEESAA